MVLSMLPTTVRATFARRQLAVAGDNLLVAVSGGADSLALLHALAELRIDLDLGRLGVAHLHHGIRGDDADADRDLTACAAGRLGLPCHLGAADVPGLARRRGLSLEEAAREARYDFLHATALKHGYDRIAVGHTRDDQAETVLMALLRGAGPGGLRGMPFVHGQVIRPLLEVTRAEVLAFIAERKLRHREDPSNDDLAFTRNRIRHHVLPLLKREFNPEIVTALAELADLVQDEERWLDCLVGSFLGRAGRLDAAGRRYAIARAALGQAPVALRRRALREAASLLTGERPSPLGVRHVHAVLRLLAGPTGGRLDLPGGLQAELDYDALVLRRSSRRRTVEARSAARVDAAGGPAELAVPGSLCLPALGWELWTSLLDPEEVQPPAGWRWQVSSGPEGCRFTVFLDAASLEAPIVVRPRRRGDSFFAHGAPGTRKLKDFLIDAKVPRDQRDLLPLLVDASGRVAAVIPVRAADWAVVGPATHSVLMIRGRIVCGTFLVNTAGAW